VNKLADTKNTNAGADVNKGLFNEAKAEGLISVANTIKNKNPKNPAVGNACSKINSVYDKLSKLNQIMDEKFGNLDKFYQKREEDLMKRLEDKEKLFNQKFKDFNSDPGSEKTPNK
jgi:hypothetical protein